MTAADFAIVGAGIAGASLAAELARGGAKVVLLEAEDQPGYHATGRSAAFWDECYGGPGVVPLTLASGPYLHNHGFLHPRGALYLGREGSDASLDGFLARYAGSGVTLERLTRDGIADQVPGLRPEWTDAIWEPACADIDVAGLHAHFLQKARRHGAKVRCRARVVVAQRDAGVWQIAVAAGASVRAAVMVNAAGAWADGLAQLAGVRPLGIAPLLRTVVQLRTDPAPPADMPLVLDIDGNFYFKPEAGRVWLSPHDEIACEPGDVAPDELSVAMAIDRFQNVVDWTVSGVERRWAGLRSFAPDRLPVFGPDPRVEGFVWFAGQGGFGIQTSPAAAKLMAQRLLGNGSDPMTAAIDAAQYDPSRFD